MKFKLKIGLTYHLKMEHKYSNMMSVLTGNRASLTYSHRNSPQYTCRRCPKRLKSQGALRFHEQCHKDLRAMICQTCLGRMFRGKLMLKMHELTHYRDQSCFCRACGLNLRSKLKWKLHKMLHKHKGKISCDFGACTGRFKTTLALENHQRTCLAQFWCGKCRTGFRAKHNLEKHLTTVHSMRTFSFKVGLYRTFFHYPFFPCR